MNKKNYLLALAVTAGFSFLSPAAQAQCPSFKGVLVDACNGSGSEGDNEFMILRNGGTAMSPSSLNIYYSPTLTGGVPSGTVNNNTVHFGGAGFNNTYSAAELTLIDNLNTANPACRPRAFSRGQHHPPPPSASLPMHI